MGTPLLIEDVDAVRRSQGEVGVHVEVLERLAECKSDLSSGGSHGGQGESLRNGVVDYIVPSLQSLII